MCLCFFVYETEKGSRSTFSPISPRPVFESCIFSHLPLNQGKGFVNKEDKTHPIKSKRIGCLITKIKKQITVIKDKDPLTEKNKLLSEEISGLISVI